MTKALSDQIDVLAAGARNGVACNAHRRTTHPMHRRSGLLLGILILFGCPVGFGCSRTSLEHDSSSSDSAVSRQSEHSPAPGEQPNPDPPLPTRLELIDPVSLTQIRDQIAQFKKAPRDPSAWEKLALVYQSLAFFELADQCYTQALTLDSSNARFWYLRGLVRHKLGNVKSAVSAIQRTIELEPRFAPAHWRLGMFLLDEADLPGAETAFQRAIDIDDNDSAGWLGLARVYLRRKENRQAAALLESLLTKSPRNVGYANRLLGTAYRRLGRPEDAAAALSRGQGSQPDWGDPWANLVYKIPPKSFGAKLSMADSLVKSGRYDDALALFQELTKMQPDNASVLSSLGASYLVNGRLDESILVSIRALEINPDAYNTESNLALAYQKKSAAGDPETGVRFYDLAMEHVERSLALNPTFARSHVIKGDLLAKREKYAEAIDAYLRAATIDGGAAQWLYRAGIFQCKLGRWADAIKSLEPVTHQNPKRADGFYFLSLAYMQTGRFDDAETAIARGRQLAPNDPKMEGALVHLAELRNAATRDVRKE